MVKLSRGIKITEFDDIPKDKPYKLEITGSYIEIETTDPTVETYFRSKGFT